MTRLSCWFRNHKDRNGKRYDWVPICEPIEYWYEFNRSAPPEKCSNCGCTKR